MSDEVTSSKKRKGIEENPEDGGESAAPPAKRPKPPDLPLPSPYPSPKSSDAKQPVGEGGAKDSRNKKPGGGVWLNLEDGLHGILATCDRNRENKCTKDLLDLLNNFVEEFEEAKGIVRASKASYRSLEQELSDELSNIRQHTNKRFFTVDPKCPNMVFVRFVDESLDPVEMVHAIFTSVQTTRQARTRFINKLIPIQKTSKAFVDQLVTIARPLIAKHFHGPSIPSLKIWRFLTKDHILFYQFMVEYRHRYNNSMHKTDAHKELVKMVGFKHRVELKVPDKVIIVEVFSKACGVSIVEGKDWEAFKGLNLRSVSDGLILADCVDADDPRPAKKDKAKEKNTDTETEAKKGDGEGQKGGGEAKGKDPAGKPAKAAGKAKKAGNQHKGRRWEEEEEDDDDVEGEKLLASLSEAELAQKTVSAMEAALGLQFDDSFMDVEASETTAVEDEEEERKKERKKDKKKSKPKDKEKHKHQDKHKDKEEKKKKKKKDKKKRSKETAETAESSAEASEAMDLDSGVSLFRVR